MWSRESFSERQFPNAWAWIAAIAVPSWVAAILDAWLVASDRLPDVASAIVVRPAIGGMFALGGAALVACVGRVRLRAALAGLLPVTQTLLVLPSALHLILRAVGLDPSGATLLPLKSLLVSWITFGFLPARTAPIGFLIAAFAGAIAIGLAARMLTSSPQRAFLAFAAAAIGSAFFWSIPSLIALVFLPNGGSLWSAAPVVLERSLIVLQQNAYWWNQMYVRFPWMSQGEAKGSVVLFFAALSVAGASALAGAFIYRALGLKPRRLLERLGPEKTARQFTLVLAGFVLALRGGSSFAFSSADIFALALLLAAVAFGWVYKGIGPIRPIGPMALVAALASAFTLGWPVFFAIGGTVIGYALYSSPDLGWKRSAFLGPFALGLSSLSLVLAGWLFGAETASVAGFGSARALLLLFALAAFEPIAKRLGRPRWIFGLLYAFLFVLSFLI